jgi:hypothetical protein
MTREEVLHELRHLKIKKKIAGFIRVNSTPITSGVPKEQ